MTRPEDPRGMLSRLPDDPDYWERLTDRVMEEVGPALASRSGARGPWWRPMARHARVLAAGAAAAVIGTVALLPERPSPDPGALDVFSLAPPDPVLTPLVLAGAPPTLAALLAAPDPEPVP